MSTASNAKKPHVIAYRFRQEERMQITLDESAYQYLCESARMLLSDAPHFRQLGTERMRKIAGILGKAENRRLWASVDNKKNAKSPRPNARLADPEDEITTEFLRLCREGHSEREARGILVSWGRWSQSTVYRRTKK